MPPFYRLKLYKVVSLLLRRPKSKTGNDMSKGAFSDRPITSSKDDVFGVSSFSRALAVSLLNIDASSGISISVEGAWGSGKSSAIALAIRELKLKVLSQLRRNRTDLEDLPLNDLEEIYGSEAENHKIYVVEFNPWNFSGQENLVRAFFKELAAQVGVRTEGRLQSAISRMASYLPSAAGGLAGAGAMAFGVPTLAGTQMAAGRAVGELAERALKSEKSLETAKKYLAAALRDSEIRIIVVIDDLDRLMPDEMRSVFSIVKSLGDLPNIVYLISYDPNVVSKVLFSNLEGYDFNFLDKIIQVPLRLPTPTRHELNQHFVKQLNEIMGNARPVDMVRFQRIFTDVISNYLLTPRDTVRLCSLLRVIWPNVKDEVDVADLVTISVLQLFEPEVYRSIQNCIERIINLYLRYDNDEYFRTHLDPTYARNPKIAKDAMSYLFPRLAKAWDSYHTDHDSYLTMRSKKRICTTEYYRNYFVFSKGTRMLSIDEVENLINSVNPGPVINAHLEFAEREGATVKPSRIATLLGQIEEAFHSSYNITPTFLRAVLDASDAIIARKDEIYEFIIIDNKDRLRQLVRTGLMRLDNKDRREMIDILKYHPSGLQLRSEIIHFEYMVHGLTDSKKTDSDQQIFSEADIIVAAFDLRAQIDAACKNNQIWSQPMPIDVIWNRYGLGDREPLREWLNQCVESDSQILLLSDNLFSAGIRTDATGINRIETFRLSEYRDMFDADRFLQRMGSLSIANPDAARRLERLRAAQREAREIDLLKKSAGL